MCKLLCLVVSLCVLFSCKKNTAFPFEEIKIDVNEVRILPLSNLLSDVKVVPLETNNRSLIGSISKIEIFNGRIYILDQVNNTLQIFDTTGKHINRLHNVGRGPGQYAALTDFKITTDGIYLVDFSQDAILHYDADLNYSDRMSFDIAPYQLELLKDGFLLYAEPNGEKTDHFFYRTDQAGNITDAYLPADKKLWGQIKRKYYWSTSNVFSFQDRFYLSCRYSNDLYLLKDNQVKGVYSLNFDDVNLPPYENIWNINILDDNFPYALRMNMFQFNRYLIIEYLYKKKRNFVFYQTEDQKLFQGKIQNDLLPEFRFLPQWATGNRLIDAIESTTLVEYFPAIVKNIPQLKELTFEDNPVLFIYR